MNIKKAISILETEFQVAQALNDNEYLTQVKSRLLNLYSRVKEGRSVTRCIIGILTLGISFIVGRIKNARKKTIEDGIKEENKGGFIDG